MTNSRLQTRQLVLIRNIQFGPKLGACLLCILTNGLDGALGKMLRQTEVIESLLESKRGRLFCLELPSQPIAGGTEFQFIFDLASGTKLTRATGLVSFPLTYLVALLLFCLANGNPFPFVGFMTVSSV